MTTAVPCMTSGMTRFEKPYECEKGIAPRLRSRAVICIVVQMLLQPAMRLASLVTMPFGCPVDPDVSFNRRASSGKGGWRVPGRVVIAIAGDERSGRYNKPLMPKCVRIDP